MGSSQRMTVYIFLVLGFFASLQAIDLPAAKVSGGEDHTLVLTSNGFAFSCGRNIYNQLGWGYTINEGFWCPTLRPVKGINGNYFLGGTQNIAAGYKHSLFLGQDNKVSAAGYGGEGQLGIGFLQMGAPVYDRGYREYPVQVFDGEQNSGNYLCNIIGIGIGRTGTHSLAVSSTDQHGWAWGSGPLGDGIDNTQYTPVLIHDPCNPASPANPYPAHLVAVSGGVVHSIALENLNDGGHVFCFGHDDDPVMGECGFIGNGTFGNTYTIPQFVLTGEQNDPSGYLKNIVAISAGKGHSMALEKIGGGYNGCVYTWGSSLGLNIPGQNQCRPSKVPGPGGVGYLQNIVQIAAGDKYSMALDADGHLWIWGDGAQSGELGLGEGVTSTTYPMQVLGGDMNCEFLENIIYISAGYWHAMAVDADGKIWSWGRRDYGALGVGEVSQNQPFPRAVVPPQKYARCFNITQSRNLSSASPGDAISYTINYQYLNSADPNVPDTLTDVKLTDFLSDGVTYNIGSASPAATYDSTANTLTWTVGNFSKGASGSASFSVTAKSRAADIVNRCQIETDPGIYGKSADTAPGTTTVNTWNTAARIYVNASATGSDNGTTWANAYKTLQPALDEARKRAGVVTSIWVAKGTYTPGKNRTDTFKLVNGVELVGGLAGTESSGYTLSSRDFYTNQTILSGQVKSNPTVKCINVVTADSSIGNTTKLNGFIIRDAKQDGVYSLGSLQILNCSLKFNGFNGLYLDGSSTAPAVTNCTIHDNSRNGVLAVNCTPTILNSCIHHNGATTSYYGINLISPPAVATIRGNTITYNKGLAVSRTGGTAPTVKNCILWGNDGTGPTAEFSNISPTYSCIDTGDNGSSTPNGNGNIFCAPGFVYSLSIRDNTCVNFHLAYSPLSPCYGKGNSTYSGESDIDGDTRSISATEIGADEIGCTDSNYIYKKADCNQDGTVDVFDLSMVINTWLTTSGSANWNSRCDINAGNADLVVNLKDFVALRNSWRWTACWRHEGGIAPLGEGDPNGFTAENNLEDPNANLENLMIPEEGESMMIAESESMTDSSNSETLGLDAQGSAPTPATRSIADRLNSLTRAAELTASILDDPAALTHLSADQIQKLQSTLDSLNDMIDELEQSQVSQE